MKIIAGLLLGLSLFAQGTSKTVTTSWTDLINPPNTVYNLYRAPVTCANNPPMTILKSGIIVKQYDDLNVTPGIYCYKVTAVNGAQESSFSSGVEVNILAPPTGLKTTIVSVTVTVTNP